MLTHPTLDKLQSLRLTGMRQALEEQSHIPDIEDLGFEERLGLLVDREYTERETRRLRTRLSKAKLRHNASPEDIDYRTPRSLDKSLMTKLATCGWLRENLNCLITGPTGIGKSWLACALAEPGEIVFCHDTDMASTQLPGTIRNLAEEDLNLVLISEHRPRGKRNANWRYVYTDEEWYDYSGD